MSVTLKSRYQSKPDAKGRRVFKGFYAAFRRPGARPACKEVPLGTKTESVARTRLVDLERREAQGLYDPWRDPPPWRAGAPGTRSALSLAEAVERFVRSRAGLSPVTVANYRRQLAPFVAACPAGLVLAHLDARHVEAYLGAVAARGGRPATVESYRTRLGVFATWCRSEGLAPATWDPVPKLTRRGRAAREETAPKFFTEAEVRRIVEAIEAAAAAPGASHFDRLLSDVVPFVVGSGLRLGEVCALRWGDTTGIVEGPDGRPASGPVFVRVANTETHTTKSGRERSVPVTPDAEAALRRRAALARGDGGERPADGAYVFTGPRGGPLTDWYLSRRFVRHVRATLGDGDRRNFHSLRHTFGTHSVALGVPLFELQGMLGHADTGMTQRYAKLRPMDLHRAMAAAYRAAPIEAVRVEAKPAESAPGKLGTGARRAATRRRRPGGGRRGST